MNKINSNSLNSSSLNTLKLKIAGFDIYPIPTGEFGLDGGAMFGTVPKVLWEKNHPADLQNRIQMEARAVLFISSTQKILIDTGNGSDFIAKHGDKLGAKFSELYNIDTNGPSLINSLKKLNVTPDDITDVILTHLHFDHAGGATCADENQKIGPTFKKANYYLQKSNLTTALNPNLRERASYLPANIQPLLDSNKLILLENDHHINLKNIKFKISNGHTMGHQCVILSDENTQFVYCGDVIPTSSHVRSAWVMGYDLNPLQLMDEKKQLLKLSENKKTYYFFEHDPYCDMAEVENDKNDFKIKEKFWLEI